MEKNPWLAAVLNFILPGAGYIYVGKRVLFGVLILVAMLWGGIFLVLKDFLPGTLIFTSLIAAVAFAYDAYRDAQEA